MVARNPRLLVSRVAVLEKAVGQLHAWGVRKEEVASAVSRYPRLLNSPLHRCASWCGGKELKTISVL